MSITSNMSSDGTAITLKIEGRFDSNLLEEFRRSYEDKSTPKTSRYVVDLQRTEHLDSSALGMLLVLRDYAGGDRANIVIANCSPEVKKIFSISSFEKLFRVE